MAANRRYQLFKQYAKINLLFQKSQKFCVECYDNLYCNKCHTCNKIIATGTKVSCCLGYILKIVCF